MLTAMDFADAIRDSADQLGGGTKPGNDMKPYRVLIIDDSLTIRAILEHVFGKDRECEVVGVASSVESARELIANTDPTVITLDLALPGMDGLEFLDELRTKTDHAPIIVISSSTKGGNDVSRQAIERGAMACFDKAHVLTHAERLVAATKRAVRRAPRVADTVVSP